MKNPALRVPFVALALLAAACSSLQDDTSRQILQPPPGELCTPADLGLAAEPFEIELHSTASLTGFFIPHAEARGRTVVLFHDEKTNASGSHPYYTFLHDAGFNVVVFDARGYGHSKGTPTLQAWIHDLPKLFDWLRARADVDTTKVAFHGIGWGAVAAMWAARTNGPCAALVVENLPSPRAIVKESVGDDGSLGGAMSAGMLEFASIPEDIEPEDGAPRTKSPALFVVGELESARDRTAQMRTFSAYAGAKRLWVLPGTRPAPHALISHDVEYQLQLTAFLRDAMAGKADVLAASATKTSAASDGQAWYEIRVTGGTGAKAPVEACAMLPNGTAYFAHMLLENGTGRARVKLPGTPAVVGATAILGDVVDDVDRGFARVPTHLSQSAAAIEPLAPRIEALRNDALPAADVAKLADDLRAAESERPFHPRVAAELADVFALLGKALTQRPEPTRRAEGTALLQRAVASVPEKPALHVWPGPTTTYGYPQQDSVDLARRLLAAPAK